MKNRTRAAHTTRTSTRTAWPAALLILGLALGAASSSRAAGNASEGDPSYPVLDGVIEAGVIRLSEVPSTVTPLPTPRPRMEERWSGRDWDRRWDRGWNRDREWDDGDRDEPFLPTHVEFYPAIDPPWRPGLTEQWRMDRDSSFGVGFGAYLNRVDGFSFLLSQEILNDGWAPTLRFYEGYGFQSEEWSGAAEARIHPFHESLSLGVRWADETAAWPLPQQAISASENFVAAFMTREDFADYLRRESRSYYAAWSPFRDGGLQVAYLDETHESRRRRVARWGIFGGDQEFSSNPEVEEGDWRSLRSRFFWLKHSRESIWVLVAACRSRWMPSGQAGGSAANVASRDCGENTAGNSG